MNSKYIDFVPSRGGSKVGAARSSSVVKKTTLIQPKKTTAPVPPRKTSVNRQMVAKKASFVNTTGGTKNVSVVERKSTTLHKIESVEQKNTKKVQLGVIEELPTRFMNAEVSKRPLGVAKTDSQEELSRIKARKIRGEQKLTEKQSSKVTAKVVPEKKQDDKKGKYVLPKSPFINHARVEKRPLSKNVYQQRAVDTKPEKLSGPVTIIEKPEKDSRISMVVIIILTIIIGAAAGTVAFLLLPR